MAISDDINRLERYSSVRGNLKRLAADADVPYTTARRMVDPVTRPDAIENFGKLVDAMNRLPRVAFDLVPDAVASSKPARRK
jgi:hypothetical protein